MSNAIDHTGNEEVFIDGERWTISLTGTDNGLEVIVYDEIDLPTRPVVLDTDDILSLYNVLSHVNARLRKGQS